MKILRNVQVVKFFLVGLLLGGGIIGPMMKQNMQWKEVFLERETADFDTKLLAPPREVWNLKGGEKICYLTFDDGPSENTEKILDILERYQIRATFFVVGDELRKGGAKVMQRMIRDGHTIGMHADVHVYEQLYAGMDSFLKDYESLYQTLDEDFGVKPSIFRFPGGSVCTCLEGRGKAYIQEMESRGFTCFDWNVSGEDAVGSPSIISIQKNVLSKGLACRRAIVLLHDSAMADKTVEALPGIIEKFKEEGFVFASLEHAEGYVFPASRE